MTHFVIFYRINLCRVGFAYLSIHSITIAADYTIFGNPYCRKQGSVEPNYLYTCMCIYNLLIIIPES